jgi:hypothetical protein
LNPGAVWVDVSSQIGREVTPVPVASVSITPQGLSLTQGTSGQLQAVARDSANNVLSLQGRQVLWSSNNLPVAGVSTLGVVQGTSIGIAQITVVVDGVSSSPVTVDVHAFLSAIGDRRSAYTSVAANPDR